MHLQLPFARNISVHSSSALLDLFIKLVCVWLQKVLGGMADREATASVIECTSEAIAGGHLDYVNLDVVVFTNIAEEQEMVELHGGMEVRPWIWHRLIHSYWQECYTCQPALIRNLSCACRAVVVMLSCDRQSTIFPTITTATCKLTRLSVQEYVVAQVQPFVRLTDSSKQRGVINIDDPAAQQVKEACRVPFMTYAVQDTSADVWVESMELSIWETQVRAQVASRPVRPTTREEWYLYMK